jgi:hypothetical protein
MTGDEFTCNKCGGNRLSATGRWDNSVTKIFYVFFCGNCKDYVGRYKVRLK